MPKLEREVTESSDLENKLRLLRLVFGLLSFLPLNEKVPLRIRFLKGLSRLFARSTPRPPLPLLLLGGVSAESLLRRVGLRLDPLAWELLVAELPLRSLLGGTRPIVSSNDGPFEFPKKLLLLVDFGLVGVWSPPVDSEANEGSSTVVSSAVDPFDFPKNFLRRDDFGFVFAWFPPVDSDTNDGSSSAATTAAAAAIVSNKLHLRCDGGFSAAVFSPARSTSTSWEEPPNKLLLRLPDFLFAVFDFALSSLDRDATPLLGSPARSISIS